MKTAISILVKLVALVHYSEKCYSLTQDELNAFTGATLVEGGDLYILTSTGEPDYVSDGDFGLRTIEDQDYEFVIPVNPKHATNSTCTPPGPIGFALNGVPFFNPFTSFCCDAGKFERFDSCNGHPTGRNAYHYQKDPVCMNTNSAKFLGVAVDGYPIYNKWNDDGSEILPSELDECGGKFSFGEYRYHITDNFPYIIGCFKGEIQEPSIIWKTRSGCQCTEIAAEGCEPV